MHQETTENWAVMFRNFFNIVAQVWGKDFVSILQRCLQCAKDFNDGIEHGRHQVCPDVRPVGDPTHMWSRFGMQLPRKCKDTKTIEPTAASQKPNNQQIYDAFEVFCIFTPTIDMLDVFLGHCLTQCVYILHEEAAIDYLHKEKYVQQVSRQQLQLWNVVVRDSTVDLFWFCPAWQGLFGAFPGMSCGSQPVEAFHNGWERSLHGMGAADQLAADLGTMQPLYRAAFPSPACGNQTRSCT